MILCSSARVKLNLLKFYVKALIFSPLLLDFINASKSTLYLAGVSEPVQLQIAHLLELSLGKLPFKYLGVAITSITSADCDSLVDKMTAKIFSWSSNFLSYTARFQLLFVVL